MQIFKEFENLSVEKKTLSIALGFELIIIYNGGTSIYG